MYFSFIDTAFSLTIIMLLIASFFVKDQWKHYCSNLIATANTLLIFYSIYLIDFLVSLIKFALSLNIKSSKNLPPLEIGWFEIRYLLLVILPFFFISKKIAKSRLAASIMLILLQWSFLQQCYTMFFTKETTLSSLFYMPYNVEFKALHFISLFIGTYALLWLLKRLPSQRTIK
jgi:hypothetical protein